MDMEKTTNFDHKVAQKYEMNSHIDWVDKVYESILNDIENLRESKSIRPIYLNEFFLNTPKLWYQFVQHAIDKNCMEISGGVCGGLPFVQHWIQGRKISIDPLIIECNDYLRSKGSTWFRDIELIDNKVEDVILDLQDMIDGFILWRNGLDHLEKPFDALTTMSSYAHKGCKLLFWTDIYHKDGRPDEGHRNITKTKEVMINALEILGWKIDYLIGQVNPGSDKLEFGCVATKI